MCARPVCPGCHALLTSALPPLSTCGEGAPLPMSQARLLAGCSTRRRAASLRRFHSGRQPPGGHGSGIPPAAGRSFPTASEAHKKGRPLPIWASGHGTEPRAGGRIPALPSGRFGAQTRAGNQCRSVLPAMLPGDCPAQTRLSGLPEIGGFHGACVPCDARSGTRTRLPLAAGRLLPEPRVAPGRKKKGGKKG